MLTRRELFGTAVAGSAAFVAGASAAHAFTVQPMPPDVAAGYALGCSGMSNGGHDQLMQAAREALEGAIARGAKPARAEEIVVCPLCGCRLVVTADN